MSQYAHLACRRESAIQAASAKLVSGTPLVHVSFGPASAQAQDWQRTAIDRAISVLSQRAWQSRQRDYQVWITGRACPESSQPAWALLPARERQSVRRTVNIPAECLRVVTYNIHGCVGLDGQLCPERIARVLAGLHADVVCLQEVDKGRPRSGSANQLAELSRTLGMHGLFAPAMAYGEGQYGLAILSREALKEEGLISLPRSPSAEQRVAFWVSTTVCGQSIQVFTTHLGLGWFEVAEQGRFLLSERCLANRSLVPPVVVCGDFNALPIHRLCACPSLPLRDVQTTARRHRTFSARWPLLDLDHILISNGLEVVDVHVPRSQLSRRASDHLPLVADLRFRL